MQAEQAIARLETGIRRLKIEYDLFFQGVNARPPSALRHEIESLIKQFANASFQRYADHYHFQTLVGRFNSFAELWNRRTRSQEEGRSIGSMPAPRATHAEPEGRPKRANSRVTLAAADSATKEMKTLYDSFVAANRKINGKAPKLSIDSFAKQLSRQIDTMKESKKCAAVEFHVTTTDSKVSLKARPAKQAAGTKKKTQAKQGVRK